MKMCECSKTEEYQFTNKILLISLDINGFGYMKSKISKFPYKILIQYMYFRIMYSLIILQTSDLVSAIYNNNH